MQATMERVLEEEGMSDTADYGISCLQTASSPRTGKNRENVMVVVGLQYLKEALIRVHGMYPTEDPEEFMKTLTTDEIQEVVNFLRDFDQPNQTA